MEVKKLIRAGRRAEEYRGMARRLRTVVKRLAHPHKTGYDGIVKKQLKIV